MNTVTITKDNALKAYNLADDNGKKMLTALLGETPKPEKITDRIKTFEDALRELSVSENMHILLSYIGINGDLLAAQAFLKLTLIARALNEGWEPNWQDDDEVKYYPWFDMSAASGFAFHVCDGWHSTSFVGSRLCFKTSELAEYAGKQFIDLYKEMFLLK